jgi:tetratricopeptide (TPR) repeat protein
MTAWVPLYGLKDFNAALPAYRSAVKVDDKDDTAHFGLANTLNRLARDLSNQGDHEKSEQALEEAEAEYRRASQLKPESAAPDAALLQTARADLVR